MEVEGKEKSVSNENTCSDWEKFHDFEFCSRQAVQIEKLLISPSNPDFAKLDNNRSSSSRLQILTAPTNKRFASRLLAWFLSRVFLASFGFRVAVFNCLRDVTIKFCKISILQQQPKLSQWLMG